MTLGERLKMLRVGIELSQEAIGAQGCVSTSGWIAIEAGKREASEKVIDRLIRWLVQNKHLTVAASSALREELLTLRYLGSRSAFVRGMALEHAKTLPNGASLLEGSAFGSARPKPLRGRPRSSSTDGPLNAAKTGMGSQAENKT
jgi:transcriptional regulator with XRE-family HTH domain